MDSQQPQLQQTQQQDHDNSGGGGSAGSAKGGGSFLCRQSSTRWTPTTDQIRILKDLYYNNGLRSPNAEQIQRISARLRQYGKIEGKNVFYWFQNHKARERQKKRFNNDVPAAAAATATATTLHPRTTTTTPAGAPASAHWKHDQDHYSSIHNKYPTNIITTAPPGFCSASSSAAGVLTTRQMGNCGYGSLTMEKSFRECSISAGANSSFCGSISHNYGTVSIDPYGSSYTLFDRQRLNNPTLEDEEEDDDDEEEEEAEIETLPLFPMHHEDISSFCGNQRQNHPNYFYRNWYGCDESNGTSRTSLELSLNSYTTGSSHSSDFI